MGKMDLFDLRFYFSFRQIFQMINAFLKEPSAVWERRRFPGDSYIPTGKDMP